MARFEKQTAVIMDADGVERTYEIIVDRSTLKRVDLHGDSVLIGSGFTRCKGKQYVGTYGRETAVLVGTEEDVYYSHEDFFDGLWSHGGPGSRGTYSHVTSRSGTGRLFAELEAFCAAEGIAAI